MNQITFLNGVAYPDGGELDPQLAGWWVHYDPNNEGKPDRNPYTAIRDHQNAITAQDIPRLALAAWYDSTCEYDQPDIDPALFDALFLSGWRWDGEWFRRGVETLGADLPAGELWEAAR